MESKAVGFRNLLVWKEAHEFVLALYKVTTLFPKNEQFALIDQIRRAAVSVPANIAEGYARSSQKEFLQFLAISYGSLSEIEYYLELSRDLEIISSGKYIELDEKRHHVGILLYGLMESVRRKLKGITS